MSSRLHAFSLRSLSRAMQRLLLHMLAIDDAVRVQADQLHTRQF